MGLLTHLRQSLQKEGNLLSIMDSDTYCLIIKDLPILPPPAIKPKDTLDTGIITVPEVSTASPTMVFTSIISLIFSIVVFIIFSIGCPSNIITTFML